jgi:hypothetical protein
MAVTRSQKRALVSSMQHLDTDCAEKLKRDKPIPNLARMPTEILEHILCETIPEIVDFHVDEYRTWLPGRLHYRAMWGPNWVIGLLVVCKSFSRVAEVLIRDREVITMCGWQGICGGRLVTREELES